MIVFKTPKNILCAYIKSNRHLHIMKNNKNGLSSHYTFFAFTEEDST